MDKREQQVWSPWVCDLYDFMKDKMILVFEKDREWLVGSERSGHCEDRVQANEDYSLKPVMPNI